MLGGRHADELIDEVWDSLPCNVELPESLKDFFAQSGLTAMHMDDGRRFPRYYLRGRAVLEHEGTYLAIYTKDLSRGGLAFYCERQLFPCEEPRIWLANGPQGVVKITRCQRIQASCYECGANFIS